MSFFKTQDVLTKSKSCTLTFDIERWWITAEEDDVLLGFRETIDLLLDEEVSLKEGVELSIDMDVVKEGFEDNYEKLLELVNKGEIKETFVLKCPYFD